MRDDINPDNPGHEKSLLETARDCGIHQDDPIWPVIIKWTESVSAFEKSAQGLRILGQSVGTEIQASLGARSEFHKSEVEKLIALAGKIQRETIHNVSHEIAKSAEQALAHRVRVVDRQTLIGTVIAAVLIVSGSFEAGRWSGYKNGFSVAHSMGDAKADEITSAKMSEIATIRANANEAAGLFADRPGEMEVWGPLIRLNSLSASNKIETCLTHTHFYFNNDPNYPGCWLPVRLPVPSHRPHTMSIPGRVPNQAPVSPGNERPTP